MRNLFKGFKFFEEDEPDKFVATVKKQLKVPKAIWLGMPVTISNTKIGNQLIREPAVFYVTDFDDASVTIANVPTPGNMDTDDLDDEIDTDDSFLKGKHSFTISKDEFYKLLEPQMPPGADTSGMGGMGGMGGGLGI